MNSTDLIAENQRLQQRIQELERKAYTDPLTGCPNRHSYLERRVALTSETTWAYVDICYLKKINDAHGHAAGDVAIAETAKVIRRHTDTVYRIGGDEFVVLLQCSLTEARAVMQRVELAMASVRVCGQPIVLAWGVGRSEEEADAAMYRHKQRCHQELKESY